MSILDRLKGIFTNKKAEAGVMQPQGSPNEKKYLNETGLGYFWDKLKAAFAPKNHSHAAGDITSGILPIERGGTGSANAEQAAAGLGRGFAVCDTPADGAKKIVTVQNYSYFRGAMLAVRFTNGNSEKELTLVINDIEEKLIVSCYPDVTNFGDAITANMTALFVYDGTNWVLLNPNRR